MTLHATQTSEDASNDLRARLGAVRQRIATCARRIGGAPEDVTLIAVSKTHPASSVRAAINAGCFDFGENRVQEAEGKSLEVADEHARWHLIGHLQANKARRAIKIFDLIHSLDSVELALRLERLCIEAERAELPVLVQVDLAGETTKSGVSLDELPKLIETIKASAHLSLRGLMILPPFIENVEMVRPFFQRLRELRDVWKEKGAFGDGRGELSMGMSHDFETAIEEGATLVRVGTAIFGERVVVK